MCIDYADATDVLGAGHANGTSIGVRRAVVAFTHPTELPLEHALCIDFRAGNADPSERIAVELDPASARELAYSILGALQRVG
jgi:hypothetical protein